MDASDDPRLDVLLSDAAPQGVPEGFADRVLAMGRARQRRGRLVRLAVAAAAALALGIAVRLWLDRQAQPLRGLVAKTEVAAPAAAEAPDPSPTGSFAAAVPPRGDSTHSVMMARFNGTLIVRARPKATEGDEPGPAPRVMVGWISLD